MDPKSSGRHVIAYASRSLTETEQQYSQTEPDAVEVVWACEHFHLYIYGKPVTMYTDHKSLISINGNPISQHPAHIQRSMDTETATLSAYRNLPTRWQQLSRLHVQTSCKVFTNTQQTREDCGGIRRLHHFHVHTQSAPTPERRCCHKTGPHTPYWKRYVRTTGPRQPKIQPSTCRPTARWRKGRANWQLD